MPATCCLAALFDRAPTLHTLDAALASLGAVRAEAGGLTLEVDEGEVAVDVFARRWPIAADVAADPSLAQALEAGAFGTGATPESFTRAVEHPWTCRDARMVAPRHAAFVRLTAPASDDAIADWMRLTRVVAALGSVGGALCAFTPSGEALRSFERVQAGLKSLGAAPAPLDLWVNTRLASLGPRWQAMDTIGMARFGATDLAAIYASDRLSYRAADAFLRNLCLYVLEGGALGDGDRLPGPDGAEWEVRASERALLPPERPLLQVAAVGGPDLGVVVAS